MSEISAEDKTPAAFRLAEQVGLWAWAAMAFLVPLFVMPAAWTEWYRLERAVVIAGKETLQIMLSAVILTAAAVALLGPGWRRYGPAQWIPAGALLLFLGWGTLSLLVNPAPVIGWRFWLPHLMTGLAALSGPLFLHRPERVRLVLWAMLTSAALVALGGLISLSGFRGLNEFLYGLDPRVAFDNPEMQERIRVQGGIRASAAISTIGNPEYVGTFCGALAALAAVVLLDWTPRWPSPQRWYGRVGLIALIGGLVLLMAATGSRQAWLALAFAAALRLFLFLGVPIRAQAAGFCAVVLVALLFGVVPAALTGLVLGLIAVVYAVVACGAFPVIKRADRFNLGLSLGFPALAVLLLIAFSTAGPWNPGGYRIAQRFASLVSKRDESFLERAVMYMLASEMIWEKPVLGVGPGRYGNQFAPTFSELVSEDESGVLAHHRRRLGQVIGVQTHNDYLQIASETGLPGLLFFLGGLLALMRLLLWRFRQEDTDHEASPGSRLLALTLLIGLIAFASIMMSSFPLQMPSRRAVFYTLVAASLGLSTTVRRESS